MVARQSLPRSAPVILDSPSVTELNIIALWVIDLSPGAKYTPPIPDIGLIFTDTL
jgi:hypothetical protein